MKNLLRIALPPLRTFGDDAPIAFALLGRDTRVLRAGELPLHQLPQAAAGARVQAVLHPADTVITALSLPPLSRKHFATAVAALVEPLTLSSPQDLAIGHGPRADDGRVEVAWTDRAALARAWRRLTDAGLAVADIVPTAAVLPASDPSPEAPLSLPIDTRWQLPARRWSLALPELRPATAPLARWRAPLLWGVAAALVWLIGLNLHASQLRGEAQGLRQAMQQQVRQAFPDIPVVVDPLKQATQRRDSLRASQGTSSESDFMPLAMAAAQLLPAGRHRVVSLRYDDGALQLGLDEDEDASTAAPDAGLVQQAAALGLSLTRNDEGWRLARAPARRDCPMKPASLANTAQRLRLPAAWQRRWNRLREQADGRWRQLSSREQKLLLALGILAALALLIQAGVRPAWRDIDAAATELPRLRAQAAQLDAMIQEAQALQGAVRGRIAPDAMQAELKASLSSAGVDGEHALAPVADSRAPAWDLTIEQAGAASLFNWLIAMPAQLRLTVQSAEIGRATDANGKPVPARVSGSLRLVAGEQAP